MQTLVPIAAPLAAGGGAAEQGQQRIGELRRRDRAAADAAGEGLQHRQRPQRHLPAANLAASSDRPTAAGLALLPLARLAAELACKQRPDNTAMQRVSSAFIASCAHFSRATRFVQTLLLQQLKASARG